MDGSNTGDYYRILDGFPKISGLREILDRIGSLAREGTYYRFLSYLFAFLFYCRIKDKNKMEAKTQSASSWIKSADELAKEAKIEYLKKHKRKMSLEIRC